MPYLNSDLYESNIPLFKVWVRKEFTNGLEDTYKGEFIHAIVCGIRTEPDKCLAFHVVFTGYEADDGVTPNVHGGACWAKMPIVSMVGDIPLDDWPERMPTHLVQPWDCSSYYHSVTSYSRLKPSPWLCKIGSDWYKGRYHFTVDYAQSTVSEDPAQHKQSHVITLTEGRYKGNIVAIPNNRCRVTSPAYWITGEGRPDFKPNNHSFCAEQDDSYTDPEVTFNNLYSKEEDANPKKR